MGRPNQQVAVSCAGCGKELRISPSKVREKNYCTTRCFYADTYEKPVTRPCAVCGKPVTRNWGESRKAQNFCCGGICAETYRNQAFAAMKAKQKAEGLSLETRLKIREGHLGKGEGKTYPKFLGRHLHKIVAEETLGRPLQPGEVVHHINEDKTDYRPENLMVFASQAEHARWHKEAENLLK